MNYLKSKKNILSSFLLVVVVVKVPILFSWFDKYNGKNGKIIMLQKYNLLLIMIIFLTFLTKIFRIYLLVAVSFSQFTFSITYIKLWLKIYILNVIIL